jgi:alcohol dehydrogenase class IV
MDEQFSTFRFLPVSQVTHGAGCVRGLLGAVGRLGGVRALVVTGPTIADQTNLLWYVEQLLGPLHAASYTGVGQHVPEETIAEAVDLATMAEADVLVSLDGGSAIDTTKLVAHELGRSRGAPPPHIALPTTLSAAEYTHYAGVTGADRVKRRVADERLVPREVFLDPRLTLPTPPLLWLSTGIKALDHAVESMLGANHHPVTDALAVEAARGLFTALPECADDPQAVEPRGRAQRAAWMSLFSPATARGGLSHALGHQLGAYGVPHGITSCVTLPAILRFVAPAIGDRQAAIAEALGVDVPLDIAVADLVARLCLPSRLRETGIARADLRQIAVNTFEEAHVVSPLPIENAERLLSLLEELW